MGKRYKNPPIAEAVYEMASTLVSSHPPVENIVQVLAEIYEFRDYVVVSSFLRENQLLFPLLLEARRRIETCFGTDAQVALEVFTDPESEDDTQLVALVQTSLPPVEAVATLNQFDRAWWLAASSNSNGKLCIHVCYE
jgi:hypothetical protein